MDFANMQIVYGFTKVLDTLCGLIILHSNIKSGS